MNRPTWVRPEYLPKGVPVQIVSRIVNYLRSNPYATTKEVAMYVGSSSNVCYLVLRDLQKLGKVTSKEIPMARTTGNRGRAPLGWNLSSSHDYVSEQVIEAQLREHLKAQAEMNGLKMNAAELKSKVAWHKAEAARLLVEAKGQLARYKRLKLEQR